MDENKLNQIAGEFIYKNYGVKLRIPIVRNNRLRSTYGRLIIRNHKAYRIDIAGILLDYGTEEVIVDILKHECIHYALFEKKLPHKDGHPVFERELKKHGAPATRQLLIGKYYILKCSKCGHTALTNRKRAVAHPEQYRMKCCNTEIKIVGTKILDGSEKRESM